MRLPAVAGRFYPAQDTSLITEIEDCFSHPLGPGFPKRTGSNRRIVAAVAPHAGYKASGMNAAHTYRAIAEDGFPEAYVIIGPDHYGVPYDHVMCSQPYLTPLGPCAIHEDIAERLSMTMADDVDAHAFEHSIEVQIPFIQYIDPDATIVPIIMHDQSMASAERLAKKIRDACEGFDVVVIASSDLSHYIQKQTAARLDGEFLDAMMDADIPKMYGVLERNRMSVCGFGPIASAVLATGPSSGRLLKHTDSFDSLGGDGNVVGYASAVFYR